MPLSIPGLTKQVRWNNLQNIYQYKNVRSSNVTNEMRKKERKKEKKITATHRIITLKAMSRTHLFTITKQIDLYFSLKLNMNEQAFYWLI